MDTPDNDLIGIEEAAEVTGYSVHTLRKYAQRGEVPFVQRKKGADLRFRRNELAAWLDGSWEKPAEPAA